MQNQALNSFSFVKLLLANFNAVDSFASEGVAVANTKALNSFSFGKLTVATVEAVSSFAFERLAVARAKTRNNCPSNKLTVDFSRPAWRRAQWTPAAANSAALPCLGLPTAQHTRALTAVP